jgi:hypothetical protein
VLQPRIPTVRAAEAFVLARHLETLVALATAAESSRLKRGSIREPIDQARSRRQVPKARSSRSPAECECRHETEAVAKSEEDFRGP